MCIIMKILIFEGEKKMIINITKYNVEIINDATKILTKKYKKLIAIVSIIFIIMALCLGASSGLKVAIIPLIGLIVVLVLGAIRIINYKKMLIERIKVTNHEIEIECKYEIDKEKVTVISPNGKHILDHKDIKKMYETKKIYLIIYSGGVFTIISKEGFKDNTEIEFKKIFDKLR